MRSVIVGIEFVQLVDKETGTLILVPAASLDRIRAGKGWITVNLPDDGPSDDEFVESQFTTRENEALTRLKQRQS